jgi:hypothetical protein
MPTNTAPITHSDIQTLPDYLGLLAADVTWALGMTMAGWGKLKLTPRAYADPAIALTTRWLIERPTDVPSLLSPTPRDIYRALKAQLGPKAPTKKTFGLVFGREGTAGYRWITCACDCHGAIRRALSILIADGLHGLPERWSAWVEMAEREAALRGIPDLLRAGWGAK